MNDREGRSACRGSMEEVCRGIAVLELGHILCNVPQASHVPPEPPESRALRQRGAGEDSSDAAAEREQGAHVDIGVFEPVVLVRYRADQSARESLGIREGAQRLHQFLEELGSTVARQLERSKGQVIAGDP